MFDPHQASSRDINGPINNVDLYQQAFPQTVFYLESTRMRLEVCIWVWAIGDILFAADKQKGI